jgi:Tfp pilus assembly protein PilX
MGNERGVALVVAVLVMVTATFFGLGASHHE